MSPPDLKAPRSWAIVLGLCLALKAMPGAAVEATAAGSPGGAEGLRGLETGGTVTVAKVLDDGSLRLDDGKILRLAGIQTPPTPPWYKKPPLWPPAARARDLLGALTQGQELRLAYDRRRSDRHGRLLAHVTDGQGRWLQGELLRRGWARVQAFPDNRAVLGEMLTLEREAREAKRGLWAHSAYAVRRHDNTEKDLGQFHLVEGEVLEVAVVRGRAYLNFGEDWRSDFTLVIERAERRRFEAEGLDPALFEGRRVRARGWLEFRNGVTITITHPEQIEVLD
ncbi:thermonuclease family protein [Denitrobaculum tricleocarpae]|uniref:Thermonuclease family protein n=1 Tax=Denitrobaculum tricleocarpae TaxID=2591009 RepID=A0A545TQY5_9PROT|nr:thermonuclease family protein [Denitrobaculum tricleocarpae]TQV79635.1 thermonuclease family protein [Denitrobaculum tricleocarpae]